MSNQKGFSKISIFVVVVVLIGSGYFVYNNIKKDKDTSSSDQTNASQNSVKTEEKQILTADEMPEELTEEEYLKAQGWKTYKNEEYGFEVMYLPQILEPSNSNLLYEFEENTGHGDKSIWSGGEDTIARLDLHFPEKDGTVAPFPKSVNLGIISGNTEKILDGWQTYFQENYETKNIKIAGFNATQISSPKGGSQKSCQSDCTIFSVVYKKPYNYIFEVGFSRLADDYMVKIYNQIISTFKFIN